MSELGFEGSVGADWAEGYGGNHVSKVWCLGNCNQVGIIEPKMCMCAHVYGVHECAHMCVSRSKSLNLGHEIHRDASENKGDML